MKNLWRHVLGLAGFGRVVVLEAVEFDPETEEIVTSVRERRGGRRRCGVCGRRSPGYDQGRCAAGASSLARVGYGNDSSVLGG